MDKKKVKDYLNKAQNDLLRYDKAGDKSAFTRAFNLIQDASLELYKSDWVSVEDRLPEFGENVVARTKGGYMNVSYRRKIPRDRISKEIMDDNGFILNFNLHSEKIAYWHKIDKLEE